MGSKISINELLTTTELELYNHLKPIKKRSASEEQQFLVLQHKIKSRHIRHKRNMKNIFDND